MFEAREIFDSREVEERIEELEGDLADELDIEDDDAKAAALALKCLSEEYDEYVELTKFRDEVDSREWSHGLTFISDGRAFVNYAQELVTDIGDLPNGIPNYIVIDWEATAENIKQDYSEVEFQGTTYLYRD